MASVTPPNVEQKKEHDEKVKTTEGKETDAEDATKGEQAAAATAEKETQPNTNPMETSNRKVIIYNVDKFLKPKVVEKLVKNWTKGTDIRVSRAKKPPRNNWIVVTVEHEDMVETLLNILNDGTHKNKRGGTLRAQRPAEASMDAKGGKRSIDQSGGDGRNSKRCRNEPIECVKTPDEVRDKLTPYWKMSYQDQLQTKTKMIVSRCLSKIITEIKKKFQTLLKEQRKNNRGNSSVDPLYGWLKGKNSITLDPILGAPQTLKYRNKCELTFGYRHSYELNEQGQPVVVEEDAETKDVSQQESTNESQSEKRRKIQKVPAVGFMAGGWAGGVSDPHGLSNIPDVVCGIANVINDFLRTSPIPPYAPKTHRGIWRTITIRSSERTKQCMIIIVHAPASGGAGKREDGSDDYTSVFEGEKQRLVDMLKKPIPIPARTYATNIEDSARTGTNTEKKQHCDVAVTSLFFQEFEGLSNPGPDHPVQHIEGKKYIEEKLLQCVFQISPGAFFQVTTEGAEQLYNVVVEKVKEVTPHPKDTLLFDVCCGTGTIGLTCMKEGAVGKVVGIDISEPAIKDAIINAERNGYKCSEESSSWANNELTRFIASRAELVMNKEASNVPRNCHVIAVVDPAREGLHPDVIKALRHQPELERIVYVSCNPFGSLVKDAGLLCSPATKKYRGLPFKIASARPVDMFPLTDHCEMVMVFDRMTQKECNGEDDAQENEKEKDETSVAAVTAKSATEDKVTLCSTKEGTNVN